MRIRSLAPGALLALLTVLAACGSDDGTSAVGVPPDARTGPDTSSGNVGPDASSSSDGAATADGPVGDGGATDGASPSDAATEGGEGGPPWSVDQPFTLSLPAASGPVTLQLDRAGVNGVLTAAEQQSFDVLSLDMAVTLTNTLTMLRNACGTSWQIDTPTPTYDCSLTAWKGPDGTWKSSPEFALVRLLTMTPANAVVDGTSSAAFKNVADTAVIGGGYPQILADALAIPRTTPIIPIASFVTALRSKMLATHPNMPADGSIPVRFYDAMNNITTVGPRFGAVPGGHPGVLDPALPPSSVILGPAFQIAASGTSNVRAFEGIVLGTGAGKLASIVDTTGPTFDDPAELALDAGSLTVSGLSAAPTTSLRFKVFESASFIPSCTEAAGCINNTQATPFGTTHVWSQKPWQAEYVTAAALNATYAARSGYDKCYGLCLVEVKVGFGGAPAGWSQTTTAFGIGSPPADQFLWELMNEVAQVSLHRISLAGVVTTLAEGQANPAFTVSGISTAVPAATIASGIAPKLAAHASALATKAAGNWSKDNANVDLFLRAGEDGSVQLWFPTAADPRPNNVYAYPKVGFFDDDTLATKASATVIAGTSDTTHEKLVLAPGTRVVYLNDPAGVTWRLGITYVAGATSATINVSKKN